MSTSDRTSHQLLVIARDPLVRAGLTALASQSQNILVAAQVQPNEDLERSATTFNIDVAVWDFPGLDEASEGWLSTFYMDTKHTIPIIALAEDPIVANRLWHLGVHAVARRDIESITLSAAIDATFQGFRLLDVELSGYPSQSTAGAEMAPLEPLTPRELEVLQLLAEGLSNKQIARSLAISDHTVKFHVNAILGKLNVQSRTEAVVNATRSGLIFL